MPAPAVASLAEKHGISTAQAEEYWTKAKSLAEEQGRREEDGDNYWKYVMGIFKTMVGETASSPYLSTLRKQFGE